MVLCMLHCSQNAIMITCLFTLNNVTGDKNQPPHDPAAVSTLSGALLLESLHSLKPGSGYADRGVRLGNNVRVCSVLQLCLETVGAAVATPPTRASFSRPCQG